MESRLDTIVSELKEMNGTLKDINEDLGVIAATIDRGLTDVGSAIRYAGKG